MFERELLHSIWGEDRSNLDEGERLMKALNLGLESGHYGPNKVSYDELEGNADLFMHPIGEAYRFEEALEFRTAGCDWEAIDFINIAWSVKSVWRRFENR